jgi:hypothetical protein
VQLLAAKGVAAPDTGGATFASGSGGPISMAANDYLAFKADLTSGPTDHGIWYMPPGDSLHLLVRSGSTAPGTTSPFTAFWTPTVNAAGHVAFVGYVDGVGGGDWTGTAGNLRKIMIDGDPLPGEPPEFTFLSNPTIPQIDEAGNVVFGGYALESPDKLHAGLWLSKPDGQIITLLQAGRSILVDGLPREVEEFNWLHSSYFTNHLANDALVAWVRFSDDSTGLFTISVPEPGAAGIALLLLVVVQRSRRSVACRPGTPRCSPPSSA